MKTQSVAIAGATAFFLNLAWENAQAPLFKGYDGFWRHLPFCVTASVGDMAIVAGLCALVALAFHDAEWPKRMSLQHVATLMVFGALIAATFEWVSLARGRWQYAGMPMIPVLELGLLPILQMTLIPPAICWLLHRLELKSRAA